MASTYTSPEAVRSFGYQPDILSNPETPDGAYSPELLGALLTEARASRMRHDAHEGGPAYFSPIILAPLERENPSEVISRSRSNSAHLYEFLDGDTPQDIVAAKDAREAALEAQGLVEGTREYSDLLHELEIKDRARVLAQRIIPGESPRAVEARAKRQDIFEYIVGFWKHSTIKLGVGENTGGGLNLALRPFATPTGVLPDSPYQFNEQYRWDTPFGNGGLILAGGEQVALDQLKNLIDVFALMGLIPNALTTKFTDHGQPPMEGLAAKDLLDKLGPGDWYGKVMRTIEQDLWDNWLDAGSGVKTERQVIVRKSGHVLEEGVRDLSNVFQENPLLTRYTNIHFSPLLVGCEDGKDHYEITHVFGDHYLPVQLNSILHGHLEMIQDYYANYVTYNPNASADDLAKAQAKAQEYTELVAEHAEQFRRVFWEADDPEWKGYRNYALPGNKLDGKEGRIKFDDLSSDVFALAFGLANAEEAQITRDNIINHYAGDQGLSTTGKEIRPGQVDLDTYMREIEDYQWRKPNCWPPLVEMAATGFERYGFTAEAADLRSRWAKAQESTFRETGFFHEKTPYDSSYDHVNPGLYGTVKGGFGWTIGVYLKSLNELAKADKLE